MANQLAQLGGDLVSYLTKQIAETNNILSDVTAAATAQSVPLVGGKSKTKSSKKSKDNNEIVKQLKDLNHNILNQKSTIKMNGKEVGKTVNSNVVQGTRR